MNIYEIYVKEICPFCLNKDNNVDLCRIMRTEDGIRCVNYKLNKPFERRPDIMM